MPDPTQELMRTWWRRLRLPLGLVVVTSMVVRNLDALGSGDPRGIVGTAAWIGFWAWLFLRPIPPPMSETPTAAQVRARTRPVLVASGIWTAVFAALVAWGAVDRGSLPPESLIAILFPGLLVLGSWFGLAKADSIATKTTEAQARRR